MSHEHPPRLPGCSVLPPMNPRPATANNSPKDKPKKRATGDRFATINSFVDCSLAELTRAEALTWFVLWRDTKDGTVRTSAADIARRIGCSRRAVTDALAGLRKRGLLTLIYRGGMNQGVSVHRVQPLGKPP
ncbi:MAG: transcriptional regulator [Planctomycetaceae bacterium]